MLSSVPHLLVDDFSGAGIPFLSFSTCPEDIMFLDSQGLWIV
jgi:hypothetical protein